MKICVTGTSGFVGRNLMRMPQPAFLKLVPMAPFRIGLGPRTSIKAELERFLRNNRPDCIIHLAGLSSPKASRSDPVAHVDENLYLTHAILASAQAADIRKVIIPSSTEVYGHLTPEHDGKPGPEPAPVTPYGLGKLMCEEAAMFYQKQTPLDVAVLRGGNLYGPYQQPDRLIPTAIRNALRGSPTEVTTNSSVIHNWIHVENFCAALMAAAQTAQVTGIFDITANHATSVRGALHIVEDLFATSRSATPPPPIYKSVLDDTLFRALTGWRPATTFRSGLAALITSGQAQPSNRPRSIDEPGETNDRSPIGTSYSGRPSVSGGYQ